MTITLKSERATEEAPPLGGSAPPAPARATFIKGHPVLAYYVLAFAISWGGFVLVVGPGGFPGTADQFQALLPSVALAMLAGPAAASLLLTGLVDGRAGYRDLLSRLLKWRVSVAWYALALLTAPLLVLAVLFTLSLTPPIFTASDKAAVLQSGIIAGVLAGFFEELGWTGFAVPRLRRRYGMMTTGLIAGVLWGAWHFLQQFWISGTYAGGLPVAVFLTLSFLSSAVLQLTAYRMLMVWVYDHTQSLLLAMLMHASLSAFTLFIFATAAIGIPFLVYQWLFSAALWIVVGAVALSNREPLSRQQQRRARASATAA